MLLDTLYQVIVTLGMIGSVWHVIFVVLPTCKSVESPVILIAKGGKCLLLIAY